MYLEETAVEVWELTGLTTGATRSVGHRPWGGRNIVVQAQVSAEGPGVPSPLPGEAGKFTASPPAVTGRCQPEPAVQCHTRMGAHDRQTAVGFQVPQGWGALQCRKKQGELYKAMRQTLYTSPFLPPLSHLDPAAPGEAAVTKQKQALDLRVHGQKMPFPKTHASSYHPEAPCPTQAAQKPFLSYPSSCKTDLPGVLLPAPSHPKRTSLRFSNKSPIPQSQDYHTEGW